MALEPFSAAAMSGDRRGHIMAINMLYSGMSSEVHEAMKWTPAMMESNNSILAGDNGIFGPLDSKDVPSTLLSTKSNGRPMDISFLQDQIVTCSPKSSLRAKPIINDAIYQRLVRYRQSENHSEIGSEVSYHQCQQIGGASLRRIPVD